MSLKKYAFTTKSISLRINESVKNTEDKLNINFIKKGLLQKKIYNKKLYFYVTPKFITLTGKSSFYMHRKIRKGLIDHIIKAPLGDFYFEAVRISELQKNQERSDTNEPT